MVWKNYLKKRSERDEHSRPHRLTLTPFPLTRKGFLGGGQPRVKLDQGVESRKPLSLRGQLVPWDSSKCLGFVGSQGVLRVESGLPRGEPQFSHL